MLNEKMISRKVELYLVIQGKELNDFNKKWTDEFDGQKYFTDMEQTFDGRILAITEDGQDFDWFQL